MKVNWKRIGIIALILFQLAFIWDYFIMHLRVTWIERQQDIIWCILIPQPPFCNLGDKNDKKQTPHTEAY